MDLFKLFNLTGIDSTTKYVLLIVASFGDGTSCENSFPSLRTIAERACVSETTVKKALRDAKANHGLKIKQGDRTTSNRYDFTGVYGRNCPTADSALPSNDGEVGQILTQGTADSALGGADSDPRGADSALGYGRFRPRVGQIPPTTYTLPSPVPTQEPSQGPTALSTTGAGEDQLAINSPESSIGTQVERETRNENYTLKSSGSQDERVTPRSSSPVIESTPLTTFVVKKPEDFTSSDQIRSHILHLMTQCSFDEYYTQFKGSMANLKTEDDYRHRFDDKWQVLTDYMFDSNDLNPSIKFSLVFMVNQDALRDLRDAYKRLKDEESQMAA